MIGHLRKWNHMKFNIEKIINEWSYRTNDGSPSINRKKDVDNLENILIEQGYKPIFIKSLIKNINESAGVFDLSIVQSIGGSDITHEDVERIASIPPQPLTGAGATYDKTKKSWQFSDLKTVFGKEGKLIITTAGSITKVRSPFGERICQLSKKVKQGSDKHLGRVHTLLKLLQIGAETKAKMAPGIGYETMQIENIDKWMKTNLGKKKSLPLFIKGKNTGVEISGGAKVPGVPKADLAFGIGGKANFFISYKHGAYLDPSGNELKAAFQQYGSVSSFFNKKFSEQMAKLPGVKKMMDDFVEAAKKQVAKSGKVYKKVTGLRFEGGKWILTAGGKDVIPKDQNDKLWTKHESKINKMNGGTLYALENSSGFSKRRSVLKAGKIGEDITMMSIFGNDYFTGKAGVNNCNILMQDNTAFSVGFDIDADGDANAVHVGVSSAGHIMWNPKIYGGGAKMPTFGKNYEPYLVARYTGESKFEVKDGLVIGCRLLIMPASQTKGGDI